MHSNAVAQVIASVSRVAATATTPGTSFSFAEQRMLRRHAVVFAFEVSSSA